jgi:hypothetical protein
MGKVAYASITTEWLHKPVALIVCQLKRMKDYVLIQL